MDILDAFLLGTLQGITEFLPISSSGHLVLVENLLGVTTPGLLFEVVVHLGSLISILFVFHKDLRDIISTLADAQTKHLIVVIIIATIPAVLVGLVFKSWFEAAFSNIMLVGSTLLFTGFTLLITGFVRPRNTKLTLIKGLLIGIAQSLAITPGISRSGLTIATALFLGIDGTRAAQFSFLLAIPAIFGAGLLTSLDLVTIEASEIFPIPLMIAFSSSLLVGIIALKWLLKTLRSGKFHWFGIYCLLIGLVTLFSQS